MATTNTYGDAARKHAVTAAGSKSYVYDANGNMTNRAGDALTYHNENHLLAVVGTDWDHTQYQYDADGQRASKKVVSNGVTTTTYYVGNWFEVTEGVTTTYYYLGGQRVAMRRVPLQGEQQVTYLHSDHLGSTSAWSGSNSGSQAYYPFGLVRATTGTPPTDFTYTGQRLDKSTAQNTSGTDGLVYYGARYYDSLLGRWGQPDTIVPDPYDPQRMNRYSYANNNPLRYNDPTGHDGWDIRNAVNELAFGFVSEIVVNQFWFSPQARESLTVKQDEPLLRTVGRTVGDVASMAVSVGEGVAGGGAIGGGAIGCGTSVLCVVGAPAIAGGVALEAQAVASGLSAAANWGNNVGNLITKATGKPSSGGPSGFRSQQELEAHFGKHGPEFGFKSESEYLDAAKKFSQSKPGGDVLVKVRGNGDRIIYNKATNEFEVITNNDVIRTYFKPDPAVHGFPTNEEYFNAQ